LISGQGAAQYTMSMEKYKASGDKALKKKEFQEAIGHYVEALEQPVPEGEEIRHKIYSNLSGAYKNIHDYRKALQTAEKAIAIDPTFARAYQRKGIALEWDNKFSAALAAYKQGAELDSDMCGPMVTELEKKMEANRTAQAERTAAAAEATTLISEAKKFHDAGNKAFKKDPADTHQAILDYTKAIEIGEKDSYPDLYIVYCNRGLMYLKEEKYEEALQSADKCIALNPNYMKGYTNRADALKKLDRHEESRQAYLKALALDRTNDNLLKAIQAEDATLAAGNPPTEEGTSTAEETDLYNVLGVERTATDDEIKSAFKKLSRKWHPDRNPGDIEAEKITRKINQAKDVLLNPVKRRAYDKMGKQGLDIIDQYGEEAYLNIEKMQPYVCPITCCLCIFAIPTLCFCCCCCCCCCAPCRTPPEDDSDPYAENPYSDDEDDIEAGGSSGRDSPPGSQRDD